MSFFPRSYKEYRLGDENGSLEVKDDTVLTWKYDLPLVGKNVLDYADEFSTTQVWLTEHFASSTGPKTQVGRLWFDTSDKTLKVRTSSSWKRISPPPDDARLDNRNIIPTPNSIRIGSEEKQWAEIHTNTLNAGEVFFRTDNGPITIQEATEITSDDLFYDGVHVKFPQYSSLTSILNTINDNLGAATSYETLDDSIPDTYTIPKIVSNRVYIVDRTSPLTIMLPKVFYSGPKITGITNGVSSEINGFTFTIVTINNTSVQVALNDGNVKFRGRTSRNINNIKTVTFKLAAHNTTIPYEAHKPETTGFFQEWTLTGDYAYV
jgi:hypothetical protein